MTRFPFLVTVLLCVPSAAPATNPNSESTTAPAPKMMVKPSKDCAGGALGGGKGAGMGARIGGGLKDFRPLMLMEAERNKKAGEPKK